MSWFALMCKYIYDIKIGQTIIPSPPREMHIRFGGRLSTQEFRKLTQTTSIELINPPLFIMVQQVHEIYREEKQLQDKYKQKYIDSEKKADENCNPVRQLHKRKKYTEEYSRPNKRNQKQPVKLQPLKLLRKTPLPGSNSNLSNFMNITKKS